MILDLSEHAHLMEKYSVSVLAEKVKDPLKARLLIAESGEIKKTLSSLRSSFRIEYYGRQLGRDDDLEAYLKSLLEKQRENFKRDWGFDIVPYLRNYY